MSPASACALRSLSLKPTDRSQSAILPPLQRVSWPAPAEPPFLRSTLESCDREIVTPSRLSISSARRASVQFVRSATGAERSGAATLSAASALTGAGPGATLALSASIPPLMKSLRHSRTVSSRTPNASAIRALVQPLSVNRMARARSASARSAPPANALQRCPLIVPRRHRRFASHAPSPESNESTESQPTIVGQPAPTCLAVRAEGTDRALSSSSVHDPGLLVRRSMRS